MRMIICLLPLEEASVKGQMAESDISDKQICMVSGVTPLPASIGGVVP
jgi:hypothetical protein